MAGVTPSGFVAKTITELRTGLNNGLRSVFGLGVNIDPRSRFGQLVGVFVEPMSEVWELGEAIANALNPRSATGVPLDNLCSLTGTVRKEAFKSTVKVYLTGNPATAIPAGKRAAIDGTTTKFELLALSTLVAAPAWITITAYNTGNIVTKNAKIWRARNMGGVTGAIGPVNDGDTDGTQVWDLIGLGTAWLLADAVATEDGPLQGFAETINIIDTPFAGWLGVLNFLDAVPGAFRETDAALRLRREQELGAQGTSPLPGIRAAVLAVPDVTTCSVFENTTNLTVNGLPAHSFEVLVEGGDDALIAQAIFDARSAGIEAFGNVTQAAVDSVGNSYVVRFSRPEIVNAHVEVTIEKNTEAYPTDGDAQIKATIVGAGDALLLGRDIVPNLIASFVIERTSPEGTPLGIAGVVNATVRVKTTGAYQTTKIVLTIRQRADYDTSRVTVISSDSDP